MRFTDAVLLTQGLVAWRLFALVTQTDAEAGCPKTITLVNGQIGRKVTVTPRNGGRPHTWKIIHNVQPLSSRTFSGKVEIKEHGGTAAPRVWERTIPLTPCGGGGWRFDCSTGRGKPHMPPALPPGDDA